VNFLIENPLFENLYPISSCVEYNHVYYIFFNLQSSIFNLQSFDFNVILIFVLLYGREEQDSSLWLI